MKLLILFLFAAVAALDAASVKHESRRQTGSTDPCPQECKSTPMEISFVVDGSSSIWPQNFTLGLNFIEDFVDIFDISPEAVRVSLVTFGEVAYVQDAFGFADYEDKDDLKLAISRVPYRHGQKTNTSGGIWHMLNHQMPEARQGVRRVVVVMTDGNSQETELTKQAAQDAKDAGLDVFAVGVGHDVSQEELHNIASERRFVFMVTEYRLLNDIKEILAYEACAKPPSPPCKMHPFDLSFVIDSSSSIGEGNFTVGMQFVQDIVSTFQVNPTLVRVSAVTFGDRVFTEDAFNFNTFSDKQAVLDKLASIRWRHGQSTETGAGIRYMRENQMSQARPKVAHICIVITDGESQKLQVTKDEAKMAQDQGIVMYAVGVGEYGKQLNEQELINIAGNPAHVFIAEYYSELNLLKEQLTDKTCEGVSSALQEIHGGQPFRYGDWE